MITVFTIGLFAVFFAFIARFRRWSFGIEVSFLLIYIFHAIRYDFGNDYQAYLRDFLYVNRYDTINYFDKTLYYEPGWLLLCRIFEPVGFFAMVATIALFTSFTYYRFIKRYVPRNYYWLAVFIYFYTPDMMLIQMSAMRQSIAITLFVFSFEYLYKKDAIRYFLCIALASLFHTSALFLTLIFFLSFLNLKINKITMAGVFVSYIGLFIASESVLPFLNFFIQSFFPTYTRYEGAAVIGSGFGIIFSSTILLLILYYEKLQSREISLLFKIAGISLFMIPLSLSIMIVVRIGFYFQPFLFIAYPYIMLSIKDRMLKNLILTMVIFISLYTFFMFFQSETWRIFFGTYNTIFTAPELY